MTTEERIPESLLRHIRRDLRPVRPLSAPGRRALRLVPLAVALCLMVPAWWGWRSNFDALGPLGGWGLSAAQSLLGLVVAGLALREAVPGRLLPAGAIAAASAAAVLMVVANTMATQWVAPTTVAPGAWGRIAWECFDIAWLSGVPAVGVVVWLAGRTGPGRPALAGALAGLAAALMTDAGTRLFCAVSSPGHVLVSHGGAIAALVALGAAVSVVLDRTQAGSAP
ncbi:MAG: NrsF family protein [Vicinamibacterales bacterium]